MKTFPMFLTMSGRDVVILGGGEQAAQKCRLAQKTEARVVVAAQVLEEELAGLAASGRIHWHRGPVSRGLFSRAALVFVATGCAGADGALHAVAKAAGALVNVVDRPELCDAITPSIVDRDPVVIAIGTEGTAPVLARQIKTRLEEMLEPRLGDLAALVGRLRGAAAMRLTPTARRDLWRWVFGGDPRATHARGAEREAAAMIKQAIQSGGAPADGLPAVSLVGAGPGSRDLITLRGLQRLQEADVIFYDRLVDPDLLDLARRDAERVYVGKAPGCHSWPQERINAVIVSTARQGKRVVRLKCGDPGIFGRGAEEAEALEGAGLAFEIVPGVTAASAAAAATGGFLTERGRTDSVTFVTGTRRDGEDDPDWAAHLPAGTTMAVYMGVAAAGRIEAALQRAGIAEEVGVRIVSHCGGHGQKILRCRGDQIASSVAAGDVANPAILLIERPFAPRAAPSMRVA